jgi:hypothetical protein
MATEQANEPTTLSSSYNRTWAITNGSSSYRGPKAKERKVAYLYQLLAYPLPPEQPWRMEIGIVEKFIPDEQDGDYKMHKHVDRVT